LYTKTIFMVMLSFVLFGKLEISANDFDITDEMSSGKADGFFAGPGSKSKSNLIGGNGGSPFSDEFSKDFKVKAIKIRSSSFIDSIQIVYDTHKGPIYATQHGGNGGKAHIFYLKDNEYITAISGRCGKYIDALKIHTNYRRSPTYGGSGGGAFSLSVPENTYFIGFQGRSGAYLDSIGIIFIRR
jgi:hypothetical protein